ncbi:hypothetical protein [Ferrimonas gelatinilytica]|uniref:Uncharacterized protein n=1 Tax=Ferrimonas gelatinilytica TaxID=1255257 RepID=A0ABP9S178_9GAMM
MKFAYWAWLTAMMLLLSPLEALGSGPDSANAGGNPGAASRSSGATDPMINPPASEPPLTLLPQPSNWRGERLLLPPPFAPELPFQGAVELRFAPGMYDPAAEDFLTLLFVFELVRRKGLTADAVEQLLLGYYRGLCRTVSTQQGRQCAPEHIALQLDPVMGGYQARLDWPEPYVTGASQRLYLELQPHQLEGGVHLSGALSAKPWDDPLWSQLRRMVPNR